MKRILSAVLLFAGFAAAANGSPKEFYAGAHASPLARRSVSLGVLADPGMAAQTGTSHGVTLTWSASPSASGCTTPCQFGYNVFRGTATGAESSTPVNAALVTGLTYFDPITLTTSPQAFFYYVEAVEISSGVTASSVPSNEVSATFPGVPTVPPSLVATPK